MLGSSPNLLGVPYGNKVLMSISLSIWHYSTFNYMNLTLKKTIKKVYSHHILVTENSSNHGGFTYLPWNLRYIRNVSTDPPIAMKQPKKTSNPNIENMSRCTWLQGLGPQVEASLTSMHNEFAFTWDQTFSNLGIRVHLETWLEVEVAWPMTRARPWPLGNPIYIYIYI